MTTGDYAMFGGMCGVAYGLVEVVKIYARRRNGNKNPGHAKMASQIDDLYNMHDQRDTNGVPIWYVPRSWARTQEKMLECLREISRHQERTLGIIERLEAKK